LFAHVSGYSQAETYYALKNQEVVKTEFKEIKRELLFEAESTDTKETFGLALGALAAKLIPLLVDGASKLFYNPDNFNKEYFASYSFFENSGSFTWLDPQQNLIFQQFGINELGVQETINRFVFELGAVKNVEGYYYLGLKSYELHHSWSKLSGPSNRINYILDIGFYYFDEDDKAQEFHINPILLDEQYIDSEKREITAINYQVIPKMKVLQTVQVRIREINSKTQNWDRYLELYQSNQNNISKFLIKAVAN
jgi:hypothetical protein